MRSLHPLVEPSRLTVILVAESVSTDGHSLGDRPTSRSEAVLALARATFAIHGRIAVPIDADIAPLVGTLALDYVQPRAAEWRTAPPEPPVVVMETTEVSEPARRLLSPLVAGGAVSIVDPEGRLARLDASTESELTGIAEVRRQAITAAMIDYVEPTLGVLIGAASRTVEDAARLGSRVRTVSFQSDPALRSRFADIGIGDPTQQLLEGTSSSPWGDRNREPGGLGAVPPHSFLMQRLIAEYV